MLIELNPDVFAENHPTFGLQISKNSSLAVP